MMLLDFTVAISTYNGASRLVELLDRLQAQTNIDSLKWEVIVIDNNSNDNTAQLIRSYQSRLDNKFKLKYYFEPQQGAVFARQRAIHEAESELVGLLDDDNLPALDWVANAYAFGLKYPRAGAFSGQVHGSFETIPPKDFKRIQSFLAIVERGSVPHLYKPEVLNLPPAAALVVRRKAWIESVPSTFILKGRVGDSMVGGEDFEVLLYLHKAGWKIWYNPMMQSYHQIPDWRLEENYLRALTRGAGLCICCLRMINTKRWQKPFIITKIFLGGLYRTFNHWLKYRNRIKTELVCSCEMEFFIGTFLSPLYFFKEKCARDL